MQKLDKNYFYSFLKQCVGKNKPIYFNMNLNPNDVRFRLVFDWTPVLISGKTNSKASAQLIDTREEGIKKYVSRDLYFDLLKENITSDYKLYKYLNSWITKSLKNYK